MSRETLYHCGKCGTDLKGESKESLAEKLIRHLKRKHDKEMSREEALKRINSQE
jgi:predicted small metal-binding protein